MRGTCSGAGKKSVQDKLFRISYNKTGSYPAKTLNNLVRASMLSTLNHTSRKPADREKRTKGQFFTKTNPFDCQAFLSWSRRANLPGERVLEPFAGENSLIEHLKDLNKVARWSSYDIDPGAAGVTRRDTIASFPEGYNVCVTNPPWLAKNSATVRGLPFPDTHFDDLYKLALTRCLEHCGYVAALVPESFIRADLHQDRLHTFISLTKAMFSDTTHPVGLALFDPDPVGDVVVYSGKQCIGTLSKLKTYRPPAASAPEIRFNEVDGNLGLIALDNTREASIRFCKAAELKDYRVSNKCRHITKLSVPWRVNIRDCNALIDNFREATRDVLLTCYRGIRKDGMYRRRLDWSLARDIICHVR